MEILHFKDLGDTECCLAANTVVLVLRKYQISIAKYLRGYLATYKIWKRSVEYFSSLECSRRLGLRADEGAMLEL